MSAAKFTAEVQGLDYEEVTWGECVFHPVPFNGFRVGPFTARVQVLPGQDREEVRRKALDSLERTARAEFKRKAEHWSECMKKLEGR